MRTTNRFHRAKRAAPLLFAAAAVTVVLPMAGLAATDSFTGANGSDWNTASHWSSGIPGNGATVSITESAASFTVSFDDSSYTISNAIATLTLDSTASTFSTTLNMTLDDNLYAATEYIGDNYNATLNQTTGTNSASSSLTLGAASNGNGTYSLAGTGVLSTGGENIGDSGTNLVPGATGAFTQSGGTDNVAGTLYLGSYTYDSGTYILQGGTLAITSASGGENIGNAGNATFNQTAGTNTLATGANLIVANNSGNGLYSLSGTGLLTVASNEYIGNGGNGTFIQSGGTNSVSNNGGFYVSHNTNAGGVYNLSGAGLLSVGSSGSYGGVAFIGYDANGTFTQSGGTASFSGNDGDGNGLYLGYTTGMQGVYNLSAGNLNTVNDEVIGYSGIGSFNQTGGTQAIGGQLFLAYLGGSSGTYSLSGASASLSVNGFLNIGEAGSDTFVQSGGNGQALRLILGVSDNASGVYSLSGTGVFVTGNADVGYHTGGTGTLAISGGTMSVTDTLQVYNTPGSSISLSGGVLNVGALVLSGGLTELNWTGGTLGFLDGYTINSGFVLGQSITLSPGLTLSAGAASSNAGSIILAGGTLGGTGTLTNNGTLSGYGTLSEPISNAYVLTQSGGPLIVNAPLNNAPGGLITLATLPQGVTLNAALTNDGVLSLNGASIGGNSTLVNNFDGTISGEGVITASLSNSGLITLASGPLLTPAFTNAGRIELGGYSANLQGGAIANTGLIQGFGQVSAAIDNTGTIEPIGGTLLLAASLSNASGGLISVASGNELYAPGLTASAGVISLTGGTIDTGGAAITNTGQITGYGVIRTGGLTNAGAVTLTGGTTTVNGSVTNNSSHTINIQYQPAIFTGSVTNNGTIYVTSTTATFAGPYSGNAYVSDPSTNIFQNNVTITTGGSMTGDSGGEYLFSGGIFTNQGTFSNAGLLQSSDTTVNNGTLMVTGTSANSITGPITGTGTLAVGSGATLTVNNITQATLANNGTTNINGTGTIGTGGVTGSGTLNIGNGPSNSNVVQLAANSVQGTQTAINVASGSTLDITNNSIILTPAAGTQAAELAYYLGLVKQGYNSGSWTGTGITSSAVAAANAVTPLYGIAVAENDGSYGTVVGLANGQIEIAEAVIGDATLSGTVNFADFVKVEGNYGLTGADWDEGDFFYTGTVNFADFVAVEANFGDTNAISAPEMAAMQSFAGTFGDTLVANSDGVGFQVVSVPEPASVGVLALAGIGLLAHRRRRAN